MKDKIHPRWFKTEARCGCGNAFVTYSTRPTLTVEICSNCHPFYTGQQKLVDAAGRVDRFRKRYATKA